MLLQLIDAYTPDEIEIGTRLEPFVPDYIPTIGLPFDGIQVQAIERMLPSVKTDSCELTA